MSDRNDRNRRNDAAEEVCCIVCDTDDNGSAEAAAADAESEAVETASRRESDFSEPVCINTNQIYDSCRDRDCVTDARVYFTEADQEIVDNAINAKLKKAEIIWVYTNVEPLSFNNGYFSVDLKFFVRATLEIFSGVSCPVTVCGLTTFDKRVILFGSEGKSKVFKSNPNEASDCDIASSWQNTSMPTVVVETVDPIALSAEIVEKDCCGGCGCGCDCGENSTALTVTNTTGSFGLFPRGICDCFDDDLVIDNCQRQIHVSFGLFSIVRLERDSQLLIDAVDFCIPTQECPSATENNPCDLFNGIRFPIDEFFPPQRRSENGNGSSCGCGCKN